LLFFYFPKALSDGKIRHKKIHPNGWDGFGMDLGWNWDILMNHRDRDT
jgi:hypothetical protein